MNNFIVFYLTKKFLVNIKKISMWRRKGHPEQNNVKHSLQGDRPSAHAITTPATFYYRLSRSLKQDLLSQY